MCSCELPKVFTDTLRRSRKPKPCDECRQDIVRGEIYHDIAGLWDGSWSSLHICLFCNELRILAEKDGGYCECIPIGGLEETLDACHDEEDDEGALLDAIFPFRVERRAKTAAYFAERARAQP